MEKKELLAKLALHLNLSNYYDIDNFEERFGEVTGLAEKEEKTVWISTSKRRFDRIPPRTRNYPTIYT